MSVLTVISYRLVKECAEIETARHALLAREARKNIANFCLQAAFTRLLSQFRPAVVRLVNRDRSPASPLQRASGSEFDQSFPWESLAFVPEG
jgi:hypothetical protein